MELGRRLLLSSARSVRVQVGTSGLCARPALLPSWTCNCLAAFELKVQAVRAESRYAGKLAFYLEALDRDVRKRPHEQSSHRRAALSPARTTRSWNMR